MAVLPLAQGRTFWNEGFTSHLHSSRSEKIFTASSNTERWRRLDKHLQFLWLALGKRGSSLYDPCWGRGIQLPMICLGGEREAGERTAEGQKETLLLRPF
jgi:hypothetical protein